MKCNSVYEIVLVTVTIAAMKHYDQKQFGEVSSI